MIPIIKNLCPIQNTKDLDIILKGTEKKSKMIKQYKKKYTKKIQNKNENDDKHKSAKERKIKSDLIVIRSLNSFDEKKSVEETWLQAYGIRKNVSWIFCLIVSLFNLIFNFLFVGIKGKIEC